ncbi:MAG TPA: hypothetical protein VLE94_20850 [Burkholderiaceae bacterium]|nr:hypothetical protein [Burkholderiaceae bacterium]
MASVVAWWGAITGTVGIGLAALSGWQTYALSRSRVLVEPRLSSLRTGDARQTEFVVRVVNRSPFEVKVTQAGIVVKALDGSSSALPLEGWAQGLPHELLPRTMIELTLELRGSVTLAVLPFDHAFVELESGEQFRSETRHRFVGKTLTQIKGETAKRNG